MKPYGDMRSHIVALVLQKAALGLGGGNGRIGDEGKIVTKHGITEHYSYCQLDEGCAGTTKPKVAGVKAAMVPVEEPMAVDRVAVMMKELDKRTNGGTIVSPKLTTASTTPRGL